MKAIRDACEFAFSLLAAALFGAAITALLLNSQPAPRTEVVPVVGAAVPRSHKWPAVREKWLKQHPVCAACGTRESLEVHHKQSFRTHPELELDQGNLITLCRKEGRNCHFRIGHCLKGWDWHNPNVEADAAASLRMVQSAVHE